MNRRVSAPAPEQRLTLNLQIDLGADEAPTGQLVAPDNQPQPFSGWLGLMAAIRNARESHSGTPREPSASSELESKGVVHG
jgi:hypothetical protein